MNVSLVEAAWDIFDGIEMENGFEMWRALNMDTTQKTQAELEIQQALLE